VNFKYLAEALNSTEFDLYFVNYHGKEPVIYADLNGYAGVNLVALATALGGINPTTLTAAGGLVTVDLLGNVRAKREYAENIRMLGASFNTALGKASVFGEISYRPNMPIGISATNDLVYDMAAQGARMADTSGLVGDGRALLAGQWVERSGGVHNYERVEMYNGSLGSIYNFGPMLGFNAVTGVAELASEHIRGSSLKYQAQDGTTRHYAGRGNTAYIDDGLRDDQINRNAYGYTLVLSGTWNDAFAGVNVSPYLVYKDDFEGNSHMTGNFVEGRKAYTLGLRGNYSQRLEAELQYTEFWGGGQNNKMRDRDNIGINIKYSF